ncbi:hypothetical protein JCM30471_35160 [Desulfuromonas carbonis]
MITEGDGGQSRFCRQAHHLVRRMETVGAGGVEMKIDKSGHKFQSSLTRSLCSLEITEVTEKFIS